MCSRARSQPPKSKANQQKPHDRLLETNLRGGYHYTIGTSYLATARLSCIAVLRHTESLRHSSKPCEPEELCDTGANTGRESTRSQSALPPIADWNPSERSSFRNSGQFRAKKSIGSQRNSGGGCKNTLNTSWTRN